MSKPSVPLDSDLAKIFGNNTRLFRAMRELFQQSGNLSQERIEEALIAAGIAGTSSNQALDAIEKLTNAIELIVSAPPSKDMIQKDDLTPRFEMFSQDSPTDLAPV